MIVSNTTPLINFYSIERMDILENLFNKIVIPEAVSIEISKKDNKFKGINNLLTLNFIQVSTIHNKTFAETLKLDIDDGESEAIALAKELDIKVVLMDELSARTICKYHSLDVLGSIGCLILAKEKGLISQVKTYMDGFKEKANFWIKDSLYKTIIDKYE